MTPIQSRTGRLAQVRWEHWLNRGLIYLGVAIFLFIVLLPFYWIFMSSFTPKYLMFSIPPRYFPQKIIFDNYVNMTRNIPYYRYLANSLIFAIGSSALSVVFSFLASYALARMRFRGSNIIFMFFILSIAVPQIGTIVPLFAMYNQFGLINKHFGLILLMGSLLTPFTVWIMVPFVQQIPAEIEEAARIDGAKFAASALERGDPGDQAGAGDDVHHQLHHFVERTALPAGLRDEQGHQDPERGPRGDGGRPLHGRGPAVGHDERGQRDDDHPGAPAGALLPAHDHQRFDARRGQVAGLAGEDHAGDHRNRRPDRGDRRPAGTGGEAKRFEEPDRVPVWPAINYRYLLPMVGGRFRDYYADPETMLRSQILGQKWLMEHIKTDQYAITGAWVGGWTDFQNTTEASSLGCEVIFPDDDIPWVGPGWVKTDADLRRLEKIDVTRNGLNGRQVAFRRAMMAVAEKYPVRFQGGPVFYPGANPALTHTSHGPFGVAADLMGQTEMFSAIIERPEFARELMSIVTDKIIAWLDFCWAEMKIPHRDFAWTDDLAAYLSPRVYREMVLPFEKKLRFHFDGWASLHMCGHTNHLLRIFADDVRIKELQGFGWEVDLDLIGEVMGGRVVLLGNVSPVTIATGTPDQVKAETRRVIEKLGRYRGLIIQDGNNIAPGSPVENINAMMEAAEEYGRYPMD